MVTKPANSDNYSNGDLEEGLTLELRVGGCEGGGVCFTSLGVENGPATGGTHGR